jgi:hypothetical protein
MPTIPNFTSARWQHERTNAQLIAAILEGKGNRMPAFAGSLSRKEASGLAAHIRGFAALQNDRGPDESMSDFQARFRELQQDFERLRKEFQDLRTAHK